MKKITFSLFALFLASSINAQIEPDTRFLFNTLWSIMPHDSIVFSDDTGAAFAPEEIAWLRLFPDGKIDSMNLYDSGSLSSIFSGVQNGNETSIVGFEDFTNLSDTSAKYVFLKDGMGRDSLVTVYYQDNGSLVPEVAFQIMYTGSTSQITNLLLQTDVLGTGVLATVADYQYYYSNNRIDSVEFINLFAGGFFGKTYNTYDSNGKLIQFDVTEEDGNGGFVNSERYFFNHNAQGEINEVIETAYDSATSQYEVEGAWRYFRRVQSNISLKEEQKITVTLYPNPTTNFIRIESEETFDSYEIMSLTGKIVLKGKMSTKINVEDLHSGIYLISLKQGDHTEIRKFHKA